MILAELRTQAAGRLAELESAIADINERLRLAADDFSRRCGSELKPG